MKVINVQISEVEYDTFGLSKDNFLFPNLPILSKFGLNERQRMKNV